MTNYAHGSITDLSASTSHYLSISCLNRNIFKKRAANVLVPSPHCKVSAFNVNLSLTKDNITDQVVTYATSNQKKKYLARIGDVRKWGGKEQYEVRKVLQLQIWLRWMVSDRVVPETSSMDDLSWKSSSKTIILVYMQFL